MRSLLPILGIGLGIGLAAGASAQIPDLLNSLDPGSPSLGAGGAFAVTNADTFSTYFNPASLGYVRSRTVGAAYRNYPTTVSRVSGNFADPAFQTQNDNGKSRVSHLGYLLPLKGGGTFGVSYTSGGTVDDLRGGSGLQVGNLTLNNYTEKTTARPDFYTLAYGRTTRGGSVAFGAGLVFASQRVENRVTGVLTAADGSTTPFNNVDVSDTGFGVGVIAGLQFSPTTMPNTSFGVSLRTPIKLGGNDDTSAISDRIPGVFRAGFATRMDNTRRGRQDYLVYGAHLATYFGGEGSSPLDRRTQTTLGVGLEYALASGSAFVPLRLGYMLVPSGGDGFTNRNALTLGVGYRPGDGRYSLDLAYVLPRTGGGRDLAITAAYRFR